MTKNNVLAMILAGGEGKRMYPLTKDRAKPAVPFGGRYRIIDFVINNFINSGIYKIKVLTQYKSDSLIKHITRGWPLSAAIDQYIDIVPAQMRTGANWYQGTADAIYQNLNQIIDENPQYVCVFGGDHIYKMDIHQMIKFHKKSKAHLTISAIPVPIEIANQYGIIEVDDDWRLTAFIEKPKTTPRHMPGHPDMCLASMGNYVFDTSTLVTEVERDAILEYSSHDFGKDIIPYMLSNDMRVYVYDFNQNEPMGISEEEKGYWRDVGTVDAYYKANMELTMYSPIFNLYSKSWPIKTFNYNYPPAKFIWNENDRIGMATNSLVSEGCIISGSEISHCVISPNVRVNSFSKVVDSIIMEDVSVGRNCEIRNAIIDKNVEIPEGTKIGLDKEKDLARGFFITPEGIVVVPKGAKL
ncbi:glucose-1-phosphate adenylyltransferase [bacterium]|nr:glucose-1-phosphate adenylyltransferase [bacterium]